MNVLQETKFLTEPGINHGFSLQGQVRHRLSHRLTPTISCLCCRRLATNKDYWLGYHRETVNDPWQWFGVTNNTFKRWMRGYPENRDCSRISVGGRWKDRDCDNILPYVCKKPARMSIKVPHFGIIFYEILGCMGSAWSNTSQSVSMRQNQACCCFELESSRSQ